MEYNHKENIQNKIDTREDEKEQDRINNEKEQDRENDEKDER